MKKTAFLVAMSYAGMLLSLVSACKEDSGSDNYLRGKIDGSAFDCHLDIWATPKSAGDQIIAFRGSWGATSSIQFFLDGQGSDITAGTYSFQTGKLYSVTLFENNEGYSAGYFCGFASPCTFTGSGRVTFLELGKQHIRGTFEFIATESTGTSKTVTEGEFYIKR